MWMMLAFALNSVLNFVVNLLVAKFLGPAEYGRFVLALSTAVFVELMPCSTGCASPRHVITRSRTRAYLPTFAQRLKPPSYGSRLSPRRSRSSPMSRLSICHCRAARGAGDALRHRQRGLRRRRRAVARALSRPSLCARSSSPDIRVSASPSAAHIYFRSASLALIGFMISSVGACSPRAKGLKERRRAAGRSRARRKNSLAMASDHRRQPPLSFRALARSRARLRMARLRRGRRDLVLAYEIGVRIVGARSASRRST